MIAEIHRKCPVCGASEPSAFLTKGLLRLVSCGRCAMIYVDPVPEAMASGRYYNEEAGYYLSADKLESDYAGVRFERELRLFRENSDYGAVLDVGCSSGAFLYQLNSRFPGRYEVLGTDVSGPALDYAESHGVPVIRGDFLEQGFGGKQFDAVTFWAVLEHLQSPRLFLEKAAILLKPKGLCFVLVPNARSLGMRILGIRYRYIYSQHLNYFTRHTLLKIIPAEFSLVQFRCMHFNPVVVWQDWRGGGAEVSNEERARLLRKTTAYKQNPLLRPAQMVYKLAERVLGKAGLADNLALVLRKT